MTRVVLIKSMRQFKEDVLGATDGKLTVVHFFADWADQCQPMDEALTILADEADEPELKSVNFYRVDAENIPNLSDEQQVEAVPTVAFYRNGKGIERIEGVHAASVTKTVLALAKQAAHAPAVHQKPKESNNHKEPIDARLKKLVNVAKIVLFMKGNREQPKCGFSRQTVELLSKHGAEYSTFDILSDEEVRQGLKTFSNWPTYPQLYVNGELVGGLDILKEMDQNGELNGMLPTKNN